MPTYKPGKTPPAEFEEFAQRAFSQTNLKKLLDESGGKNYGSFKTKSRMYANRGYYESLFQNSFVGRDGKERVSHHHRLSEAVFEFSIKPKQSEYYVTKNIPVSRSKKASMISRTFVSSGHRVQFKGKIYGPGKFLPKSYFDEENE